MKHLDTMKNKLLVATMLCSLAFGNMVKAQDARFTQYYAVPFLLNPGIIGAADNLKASLDYRNQWGSVNSGYTNYAFNGMYPIQMGSGSGKLDLGLSFMGDKAGAFSTMNASLVVAYSKEIAADNHICAALIGGYGQQSLSTSGLTFDDQYVNGAYAATNMTAENILNQKAGYADVGAGVMWYYNPKGKFNAFFGVSGYNLNQPNLSMTGSTSVLPMRMSYQVGVKILSVDKFDFTPNAYVNYQAGNTESAIGTYADYHFSDDMKVSFGFWYRRKDAIPLVVGFNYKGFTLGYSYDAVISNVHTVSSGVCANEISLTFSLSAQTGSVPQFGGGGGSAPTTTPGASPFPSF